MNYDESAQDFSSNYLDKSYGSYIYIYIYITLNKYLEQRHDAPPIIRCSIFHQS